jgi:predicted DNA-binding transcriptional regulator YafY
MPKADTRPALARQWELLKCLPRHPPGATVASLTERLGSIGFIVSKRTVERDMNTLASVFGIRCNDVAETFRWHWIEGQSLDLPGLDFADALSLTLIEDLLGELLPVAMIDGLKTKFAQARDRLAGAKGNRYVPWRERMRYVPPTLPFQPPKIVPHVLTLVQTGLIEERQLNVTYSSVDSSSAREFTLHPLAFVQQGAVAYLVATAYDFTDPRLYALHRISSVHLLDERARRPEGFSLDAYLAQGGMQFGEGSVIRLKAEVTAKLGCYLEECPLAADQKLVAKTKDVYLLKATIKDSWLLQFWILSQGAEITVVQPKELRMRIRSGLQAALSSYGSA